MGKTISKCWIIVHISETNVTPAPFIYLREPHCSEKSRFRKKEFNNVFEAKNYIRTFVKHLRIEIISGSAA